MFLYGELLALFLCVKSRDFIVIVIVRVQLFCAQLCEAKRLLVNALIATPIGGGGGYDRCKKSAIFYKPLTR